MAVVTLVAIVAPSNVKAQTRYLVGVSGTYAFDNRSLGVTGGIEIPVKRVEIDLADTFSPFETHVSLGGGRSNLASAGGLIWLTKGFGLTGKAETSSYDVTQVSKHADYGFGGIIFRTVAIGSPIRVLVQYIRQFNNGISPTGLETSHLSGADINLTVRMGCSGPICFRVTDDNYFGRVLTQGDPYCDGSIGPQTCGPRGSALGGGFTIGVLLEFPRPRGHENEAF